MVKVHEKKETQEMLTVTHTIELSSKPSEKIVRMAYLKGESVNINAMLQRRCNSISCRQFKAKPTQDYWLSVIYAVFPKYREEQIITGQITIKQINLQLKKMPDHSASCCYDLQDKMIGALLPSAGSVNRYFLERKELTEFIRILSRYEFQTAILPERIIEPAGALVEWNPSSALALAIQKIRNTRPDPPPFINNPARRKS